MCDLVRAANPDVAISCSVIVGVGDPATTNPLRDAFAGSLVASWIGEPDQVAANLATLQELGISRLTLIPIVPHSHARIAPHLTR